MSEQNATPKRTEVVLLKDGLTHQQRDRKTGDKIHVTDRQIAFLAERGFIAPPKGGKSTPTTPEAN